MQIKEIMTRSVEVVRPDSTLQDAAAKMKSLDVGALPVVNGDQVAGLLTDRDIVVRAIADGKDPRSTPVREVMSADVVAVTDTDDAKEAARVMKERQIRRLVVVDASKRVCGIVSLGDLAVDVKDDRLKGQVLEEVSVPSGSSGGRR